MARAFLTRFFLFILVILGIPAVTTFGFSITLYPPQYALIHTEGDVGVINQNQNSGRFRLGNLPKGILPGYFSVDHPEVDSVWTDSLYQTEPVFLIPGTLIQLPDKSIVEFVAQTPEHLVVRAGGKVSFLPKETVFAAAETVLPQRSVVLRGPSKLKSVQWSAVVSSIFSGIGYSIQLGAADTPAVLSAFLTMTNQSDLDIQNAQVDIKVGGTLFESSPAPRPMEAGLRMKADAFQAVNAGEIQYFYSSPIPVSVSRNSSVQIRLFSDAKIRPQTIYRFVTGEASSGRPIQLDRELMFQNKTGFPLAPGPVQIIAGNKLVSVGNMQATPVDSEARIGYGKAFEVAGTRKIVSVKDDETGRIETIEIGLINTSAKAATVEILETYWGNWEVVRASTGYRRISPNQLMVDYRLGPKQGDTITLVIRYLNK
ncbi:hypothetical protein EBR96_04280 [bacterium]|nr:hypothetical protein [bacterium]